MNNSPKTNQPAQVPSTNNGVLRKADALRVRKVASSTPNPFVKQQPTMNTQWTFRISKDIVVDNTKMPSNMDFWGMLALQMKNDE
jgi:hypothetical protein